VIRGFNAVALRELPADHVNRPDLEAVKREVVRSASLLERFLVFARARPGKAQVQTVEPVLAEVVEVLGPAAKAASVGVELRYAPDAPDVRVDPELLRQAFMNLGLNAIQAMQPVGGGMLRYSGHREGSDLLVQVQDDGPGMDEETRAKGLRALLHHQGDRHRPGSRHRAPGGRGPRGLGLGGEPARGGCDVHHPAPRGHGEGMKLRVMVIDDLDSARQMVKRALGRSFDVYDFASVAEALPALDRAAFDVIVTDLRMPGIDGLEG